MLLADRTNILRRGRFRAFVVLVGVVFLCGGTVRADDFWWDLDWSERKKLAFTNSAQSSNLVDFPVVVFLNSSRIDFGKTQDLGEDVRFTDSDGITLLDYEIEKWDEAGTCVVWVNVPQVDGGSNADYIWMYYDNIGASDAQASIDVWDDDYVGVWHLGESGSVFGDSTGYGNDSNGLGDRKCELKIDKDKVPADLTDFPVLLTEDTLPSEMLDKNGFNPALDGGGDIRFSSDAAGTNRLPCEVVTFTTDNNPSNGEAEIWVSVPSVSSSADTSIWVWYGTPGAGQPAAAATYGAESVWDDSYQLVWHMDEAAGTTIFDSTGNGNDGTKASATEPNQISDGQAGSAQYFDYSGDGNVFNIGLRPTVSITMEAWIRPVSYPDKWMTICQFKDDKPFLGIYQSKLNYWRKDKEVKGTAVVPFSVWSHAAVTHAGATAYLYLDGALDNSGDVAKSDIGTDFQSGGWGNDVSWDGDIDEVRVSTIMRSADWIATGYNSQSDPSTFVIEQTPMGVVVFGGPTQTSGTIGDGQAFDGGDFIVVPVHDDIDVAKGSVSAWIELDSMNAQGVVLSAYADGDEHIEIKWDDAGGFLDVQHRGGQSSQQLDPSFDDNADSWRYVTQTWDTAADEHKVYADGVQFGNTLSGLGTITTALQSSVSIGSRGDSGHTYRMNGKVDEVRFSKTPRSGDWVAAQYLSMTDRFIRWRIQVVSWDEVSPVE